MISDVLCDAIDDLQDYLDNEPEMYDGESRADVLDLIARMQLIVRKLMNPYAYAEYNPAQHGPQA